MNASPIKIDWNPDISIYASEAFLRTVSDEFGWLGGATDSGIVRCVLPYSVIRKSLLSVVRFPVQTILLNGEVSVEEERLFLQKAASYFSSIHTDVIVPATFNSVFRTYPEGATAAPFGSYILDLHRSEKELWDNLHSKHRNVVRNALKKGVKILCGPEHLDAAFDLVQDSFKRSAKGIVGRMRVSLRLKRSAFRRQVEGLGKNVKIFLAEFEGVQQGCAVIPFSSHSAYYMHGGSIPNPLTGAMNLLQWEAIRLFQQLGVRRYDFFGARVAPEPGSKIEGIMKFKERFGAQFVTGYMWKLPLNRRKYFLYSLAARIRSGGDFVDQERHKLGAADECPP